MAAIASVMISDPSVVWPPIMALGGWLFIAILGFISWRFLPKVMAFPPDGDRFISILPDRFRGSSADLSGKALLERMRAATPSRDPQELGLIRKKMLKDREEAAEEGDGAESGLEEEEAEEDVDSDVDTDTEVAPADVVPHRGIATRSASKSRKQKRRKEGEGAKEREASQALAETLDD